MLHAPGKPRHEGTSLTRKTGKPVFSKRSCPNKIDTHHRGITQMKRRDFIKVTGMSVAGAATMAAPAIAQSMPEIKWRMTTSWPKSLDTLHGAAIEMARAVGEATDNKFQIQTFAAGEIV